METNRELKTRQVHNSLDLVYIVVNRLLAENVLASVDSSQGDDRVSVGGGANEHSVYVLVVDDIHVVSGNVGDAVSSTPVTCTGLVDHGVSNSDNLNARNSIDQVVDVQFADSAAAYDANA